MSVDSLRIHAIGKPPTFGEVLLHILQLRHMKQSVLAHRANVSESLVSKLLAGQRELTTGMAQKLADILGGNAEIWQNIFSETRSNASRPLAHLVQEILGKSGIVEANGNDLIGTPVRQLRRAGIIALFSRNVEGSITGDSTAEESVIEPFDAEFACETSYDTHAGSVGIGRFQNGDWKGEPILEKILIPARGYKYVGTLECIKLPSWLEAEIHPASNITLKPLIVSHGPIIDPGWGDGDLDQDGKRLFVSVINPTDQDIYISVDEPFLTLRFWVSEIESTPFKS